MKHKKVIVSIFALTLFAITALSLDLKTALPAINDINKSNKLDALDKNIIQTSNAGLSVTKRNLFQKRFVYFDRSLTDDENFDLAKKVILDAKRLGFNGIVIEQEYAFTRLSHQNKIINKMRHYMSELERLAHRNNLQLIAMHFRANVPNEVIHDGSEENSFYTDGKFDFSEATQDSVIYEVNGSVATPVTNPTSVKSPALIDRLYHFKEIQPESEYTITVDLSTQNYKYDKLKVSVLDEDYTDENGKVLFGVNKFFTGIQPNGTHLKYSIDFNSLNHPNTNGKIKVYIPSMDGVTIHSVTLSKTPYKKSLQVVREQTPVTLSSTDEKKSFQEGVDYTFDNEQLVLLSDKIKTEKSLKLSWYPAINVSLNKDYHPFADVCADPKRYYDIMSDQLRQIREGFNGKIDAIALDSDEWRTAGWDLTCLDSLASGQPIAQRNGGAYIGLATRRLIEQFKSDLNNTALEVYIMSDMFDPNFNGKNPYMGVNGGAVGAAQYLPKENSVMINWFPNPYEPGMEDKKESDFLASAKFFADQGLRQIIAGYHDDMRNLDANINVYKKSDPKTQESIIGFMYLIWFQDGKSASYDDMDDTVKRICQELPGKWPESACKRVLR